MAGGKGHGLDVSDIIEKTYNEVVGKYNAGDEGVEFDPRFKKEFVRADLVDMDGRKWLLGLKCSPQYVAIDAVEVEGPAGVKAEDFGPTLWGETNYHKMNNSVLYGVLAGRSSRGKIGPTTKYHRFSKTGDYLKKLDFKNLVTEVNDCYVNGFPPERRYGRDDYGNRRIKYKPEIVEDLTWCVRMTLRPEDAREPQAEAWGL